MNLRITNIRDIGVIDKERIVMKVLRTIDVGDYAVLMTGLENGDLNTDVKMTYWFPNRKINSGDFVVLYTKRGSDRKIEFKEKFSYFFYWGLKESIWDKICTAAVLLEASNWQSFDPLKSREL